MKRTAVTLLVLGLAFGSSSFGKPPEPQQAASPAAAVMYAPDRDYDLLQISLDLRVDYATLTISGTATNRLAALRDGLTEIALDCGRNLSVDACAIDGRPAAFSRSGDKLEIDAPGGLERGKPLDVEVRYSVHEASDGLHWIRPRPDDAQRQGFWTIGQPEYNRTWFPTWDYPNDFAIFETRVSVPADWTAVGNGALRSDTMDPGGKTRTFHWVMDQPCATYLLSLTAGPLDIVRDAWQDVPLLYTAPRGKGGMLKDTFGETPDMLTFYSDLFGLKYPWPKYAECVMYEGGGAMENVSATLFSDSFLSDRRSGFRRSSPAIAHELVHQWLGDLVTYKNWGEVWLSEGFAILFGQLLYAEHWQSGSEFDRALEDISQGYFSESRRYKRPLSTRVYASPGDMFDNHSYLKGALVLHTLRSFLGDSAFRRGVHAYLIKHRNEPVDSHDLGVAMTEATGINVEAFFDQWVYKPGHPVLDYSWKWDAGKKQIALMVKQIQDVKDGTPIYRIGASVGLISGGRLTREKVMIGKAEQELSISAPARPDAVLLDPDHDFLREIPASHWGAGELPHILRYAPNAMDRQEAMARLLESSPPDETVRGIVDMLRADKAPYPVFRSIQKLVDLGRADLRAFYREEVSHAYPPRRVGGIQALARLPKDRADIRLLRGLVNDRELYDVVRASLKTLRSWDAAGNRDVFKKATLLAPDDKVIRLIALDGIAKADAEAGRPRRDPVPEMTQKIRGLLTEISRGVTGSSLMTEGMRSLAARGNVQASIAGWLKEERSFVFLVQDDATKLGMMSRGAKVSRTVIYKLDTGQGAMYLSFYFTAEGKVAGLDVYRE